MEYQNDSDILGIVVFAVIAFVIWYNLKKDTPAPPSVTEHMESDPAAVKRLAVDPVSDDIQLYSAGAASAPIKGIFLVITSPDPQTQMVALSLSTQIFSKGKSVRILLCGPGGDLVAKGSKETVLMPLNKSPQAMLKDLIQKKIKVEICPFYKANNPTVELIEGVTPAQPPVVADGLLEPGIKLFTF